MLIMYYWKAIILSDLQILLTTLLSVAELRQVKAYNINIWKIAHTFSLLIGLSFNVII